VAGVCDTGPMSSQGGEGLIGRDHPAGVLRAEIGRAVDSHGGLVLVTGEAGIGKTALVTGAAEEARRHDALVLSGACWDSDSAPGFWPWVQVVRGLRRAGTPEEWAAAEVAGGKGLGVLLGEVPTGAPDLSSEQGGEPVEAFQLYDAVTTALVSVSQRRPVVVVLDDLHWADTASLRLLEFAAQHIWFERLLLVGTYRDVEVESAGHPLEPLMPPLVAKATTVTLTGLDRDEVGALIARTAGIQPDPELVAEVHRRTGGNPFFVEQMARLWRADGSVMVAPGVRDAVRRRLSLLPAPVVELLTVASVLSQEFHARALAACTTSPVAEVDRLLDRAVTARLVVALGGGRFAFAHDLVRETLYDALDEPDRRRWHASVVRAVDRSAALAELLFPADVARHAYLAGAALEPARTVQLLVAAAHDASARLASEEATGHFRRALEVVEDPARRVKVSLELAQELYFAAGARDEAWRQFQEAAALARQLDDPELLARVALTLYRHELPVNGTTLPSDELLREAHRRLVGGADAALPTEQLIRDLVASTELLARRGSDDEALTFSLLARHNTIWGLGTAREREALTTEMGEVARRSGDRNTELFAASLRWVALVELGDPRYYRQLQTFVALSDRVDVPRFRMASAVDRSIIAALRGEFGTAEALLAELPTVPEHDHPDFAFMGHHLRWALRLLCGRFAEIDEQLRELGERDHPHLGLLRSITAVEQGDAEPALRYLAEVSAAGTPYPRYLMPLLLRLQAQAAAATRDPLLGEQARGALVPYRGEWVVCLYGCDISGPVDLWIAVVDAAQEHWDDAVAGFASARDAADRLQARPWSVMARAGLAHALAGRGASGDAAAAETLRQELLREAAALGMPQIVERLRHHAGAEADRRTATAVEGAAGASVPAAAEFRRDGAVWRLGYGGRVVHLPDAKGLRDLHLLLSRPGVAIPAVELLDPAAGPELVTARRMGGDPILDEEAKARYRRRLTELDEAIDRAAATGDDGRAVALDQEREALLGELRAAAGLAGRSRRLGDEAERARKTVTARIRDLLRKLDERHPELAAHLRGAVSTGAACRYAPDHPIPWRL
jgi:AAA ATPase domain